MGFGALARASDRQAPESIVKTLFELAIPVPPEPDGALASPRGTWLHRLHEPAGSGREGAPVTSA